MTAAAKLGEGAVVVPITGALPSGTLERVVRRVSLAAQRYAEWGAQASGGRRGGQSPDRDSAAEVDFYRQSAAVQPLNRAIEETDAALRADGTSRLSHLAQLFVLEAEEIDALHTAIAFALAPGLADRYAPAAHAVEHRGPTLDLVSRWFGHGIGLSLSPASGLRLWDLVRFEDGSSPAVFSCDPDILRWLAGGSLVDAELLANTERVLVRAPLPSWPVTTVSERLRSERRDGSPIVRHLVRGLPGSGRKTLAAAVAAELGCAMLAVDTSTVGDAQFPSFFTRAQRLSALQGIGLVWHGSRLARAWPRHVPLTPLQFMACEPDEAPPAAAAAVDEVVDLPPATGDDRCELWRSMLPGSAAWEDAQLRTLAERHRVTPGDIVTISNHAPASPEEAAERARALYRDRLGGLGRLMECPFDWDDLVIDKGLRASLRDFAFEAKDRLAFWKDERVRRLFPRGRGLVGLMSGPPGTGKTMASQVLSREIGLDLYRIDLATIVDKYIGETAKNLRRIFTRAAHMDAVLLFDEADALFTKRTEVRDAHDRYANADTNYLLQLLEDFSGVALLATNRSSNMDSAFVRRLRYSFCFPRPDAAARKSIWSRLVAELCPDRASALEKFIGPLSEIFDLSGAQTKNAMLGALFSARRLGEPLAAEHVLLGIERELNKAGRVVTLHERHRVLHHG